jgi:hypothetical protein
VINAIKFSIEEIEASDQYFDHTGWLPHNGAIRLKRPERGAAAKSGDASAPNQQRK